jgi:hypothetical protein
LPAFGIGAPPQGAPLKESTMNRDRDQGGGRPGQDPQRNQEHARQGGQAENFRDRAGGDSHLQDADWSRRPAAQGRGNAGGYRETRDRPGGGWGGGPADSGADSSAGFAGPQGYQGEAERGEFRGGDAGAGTGNHYTGGNAERPREPAPYSNYGRATGGGSWDTQSGSYGSARGAQRGDDRFGGGEFAGAQWGGQDAGHPPGGGRTAGYPGGMERFEGGAGPSQGHRGGHAGPRRPLHDSDHHEPHGFGGGHGQHSGVYGYESPQQQNQHGQPMFDPEYQQWREQQMRELDTDYSHWRRERYEKFSQEFNEWREARRRNQQRAADGGPGGDANASTSIGENSGGGHSGSGIEGR